MGHVKLPFENFQPLEVLKSLKLPKAAESLLQDLLFIGCQFLIEKRRCLVFIAYCSSTAFVADHRFSEFFFQSLDILLDHPR